MTDLAVTLPSHGDTNWDTTLNTAILAIQALLNATTDAAVPSASPVFTGNPTAPTPTAGDNDTSIATTAFVQAAITALIGGAPGALNTLKELADALNDDASFSATIATSLGTKFSQAISTISTTVTLGNTVATWYVALLASGAVVTLPSAASNGARYTIKNIDTANKSLATTSSQTIDGTAGPITIVPNQAIELVSDGSNWRLI